VIKNVFYLLIYTKGNQKRSTEIAGTCSLLNVVVKADRVSFGEVFRE
jgi:hypothetical protein